MSSIIQVINRHLCNILTGIYPNHAPLSQYKPIRPPIFRSPNIPPFAASGAFLRWTHKANQL